MYDSLWATLSIIGLFGLVIVWFSLLDMIFLAPNYFSPGQRVVAGGVSVLMTACIIALALYINYLGNSPPGRRAPSPSPASSAWRS